MIEDLRQLLNNYYPQRGDIYLFPGRSDGHISYDSAARILRMACKEVSILKDMAARSTSVGAVAANALQGRG